MAVSRALKDRGNLVAAIGAAVALFVFANLAGAKFWTLWDWTAGGQYTLSEQTTSIVGGLDRDVRIVSFLVARGQAGGEAIEQVEALLAAYVKANPRHVTLEKLDIRRDPARAEALLKEFAIDPRSDTTDIVVVQSGARSRQIPYADMIELDFAGSPGMPPGVKSVKVEGAVTGAILGVTRARQPVVRFATGHGEREPNAQGEAGLSRFVEALARQDVKTETWDAVGATAVPEPTDLLVVAGPTAAWLPSERDALKSYLDKGGRALLLFDPVLQQGTSSLVPTGLDTVLGAWGIAAEPTIAIDPSHAVPFFGPETFVADALGLHPVTSALGGQQTRQVLFTLARSLEAASPAPAGVTVNALFETSPDAWAEADLADLQKGLERGPSDRGGPFPIALAAERRQDAQGDASAAQATPSGRLLVVGDADWISNLALDQLANRSFALNAVAWLTNENRALGIAPKERAVAKLFLTDDQTFALFLLLVVALPGVAIAAGLTVWWRRKQA